MWKSLHEPSLDLLALQSLRLKPNQALHDLHHQLMCFRTVASCAARAILEASGEYFDLRALAMRQPTSLQFMNGRVFQTAPESRRNTLARTEGRLRPCQHYLGKSPFRQPNRSAWKRLPLFNILTDVPANSFQSLPRSSATRAHFNLDGWSIIGRITIFLLCCERTPEADHDWAS